MDFTQQYALWHRKEIMKYLKALINWIWFWESDQEIEAVGALTIVIGE